tara:strand:- start:13326 stop:14159 length:834 start_codon:yes stop_codon:yes gene_type:complete
MTKLLFSLIFVFASGLKANEDKSCFTIDTGEEFCDLAFKGNAQQLWIAGSGDLEHVKKIVSPYGVKPVLNKEGRALVSLAFVQYVSTSVGPYNELIVMYAVQRNDKNIGPYSPFMYTLKNALVQKDKSNPDYGFFMKKLVLGGENKKAVHAGIEIGLKIHGMPKVSGDIDYALDPSEQMHVSVKSHDQSVDIEGTFDSSYLGGINLMATPVIIHALSTGLGHPHWSRAVGFAWGGTPQSTKTLKLKIDGSEMKDLQFQPGVVVFSGRYRFELEAPKN